jgi:hypothetical protein
MVNRHHGAGNVLGKLGENVGGVGKALGGIEEWSGDCSKVGHQARS